MTETSPMTGEAERETRQRIARHLQDLHRVHLALAEESRALKRFTTEGQAGVEMALATEILEQYLGASAGFIENMRGRFEARLALLRRGEPAFGGRPDQAPEHGAFWLAFSRLCAVLLGAGGEADIRPQRLGLLGGVFVRRAQLLPALIVQALACAGFARVQQGLPVDGLIVEIVRGGR